MVSVCLNSDLNLNDLVMLQAFLRLLFFMLMRVSNFQLIVSFILKSDMSFYVIILPDIVFYNKFIY